MLSFRTSGLGRSAWLILLLTAAPGCSDVDVVSGAQPAGRAGATDKLQAEPQALAICAGNGDQVPAAERVSTGGPLMPPKWAFGVLWGSYYDQIGSTFAQKYATPDDGNILNAAQRIRDEYSGDLMWIDSNWLSHNYSNDGPAYVCFKFDKDAFPDPGAMIAKLRDQHFHFGLWEWPWMGHGCKNVDD